MSYSALGQAKIVPGQINFQTLPEGRASLPSLEPLVQAGLPIAPYVEHGSWETGEPSIMRYGLDPYRGIMGLGRMEHQMQRGLGITLGESLRRLEAQDYWLVNMAVPLTHRKPIRVRGMNMAMRTCKRWLDEVPGSTCYCYRSPQDRSLASQVFMIRFGANGQYDVQFNYALAGSLGSTLTDLMCSETAIAGSWRERISSGLNAGAQASILAGISAGFLGALMGRPVLGAIAGAAIGWSGHAIWTSTFRD